MSQAITSALKALDTGNDNHWTADGLPRLDTVKMLASDPTLTREKVADAAPSFTRAAAKDYAFPEATTETPADTAAQPPAQAGDGASQGDNGGNTKPPAAAEAGAAQDGDTSDEGKEGGATFSDGQTEQPEVAEPAGAVDTDEVAAMEAALAKANEAEAELLRDLDGVNKDLSKLRQARDDLAARLRKVKPERTNTNDIQDYLASQKRMLQERAARKQIIKESGLDLKELARDLKAPIDAAMARKNTRGAQRPTKA